MVCTRKIKDEGRGTMKKKIAMLLCMGLAVSSLTAGCSNSKTEKTAQETEQKTEEKELTLSEALEADQQKPSSDYNVDDYITLGDYKGLEVNYVEPQEVTKQDIKDRIADELDAASTQQEVTDRPAQNGDFVNIDYSGTVDGVEFDGGTAEDYDLELGSGDFIDGFEDQLVGTKAGDHVDVKVTFPENYGDDTLNGKEAVFAVDVNSVYTQSSPDYDDAFVASVSSKSKTTEEYELEIAEEMKKENEKSAEETAISDAVSAAVDNAEMKGYPIDLYNACYASTVTTYVQYADMFGMELKDFLEQYMGDGESGLKTEAESQVKQILVVQAIAKAEGLELTDEEYKDALADRAVENGYSTAEAMEADCGEFSARADARFAKVGQFLLDNAQLNRMTQKEYEKQFEEEGSFSGEEGSFSDDGESVG